MKDQLKKRQDSRYKHLCFLHERAFNALCQITVGRVVTAHEFERLKSVWYMIPSGSFKIELIE